MNIGQGSSLGNIGNFDNAPYWSSSEYNLNFAWVQSFLSGTPQYINKIVSIYNVRAVRAFTSNTPYYSYNWSTVSETTSSITVQPTTTTTYTVDVTSGTTTCNDDVTISVNQRDFVTIDYTACDSIQWAGN